MITKIPIAETLLDEIVQINKEMLERGNFLSVSISLPCISKEMSEKYEPKVPSPDRRIETVKMIDSKGIPTFLAIRPLLPDLSNEELKSIVNITKDYVDGYYSGPLYLNDDRISQLLPKYANNNQERKQPHWMLDGNLFKEIKEEGQIEFLQSYVNESGKVFFDGAAEGMVYIKNKINV